MEAGVATTVMVPSAEQTDTRGSSVKAVPDQGAAHHGPCKGSGMAPFTYHVLGFEEAAFGGGCLDLQSFRVSQKKFKCSIKV